MEQIFPETRGCLIVVWAERDVRETAASKGRVEELRRVTRVADTHERSVDPRLWGHDSITDRTDEIDALAETEVATLGDDVDVEKAISDASMLAVAPSVIAIPPAPPLPQDLLEDDAYFHPGGAIRSLVTQTPTDGLRVEVNVEKLRAKARRSWVLTMIVAVALPVVLVAIIVGIGRTTTLGEASGIQAATSPRTLHVAADSRTPLANAALRRATLKTKPAPQQQRPSATGSRPAFGRRSR